MRSPSIFATMRKTPCVDGCCGPMLTSTGSDLIGTIVRLLAYCAACPGCCGRNSLPVCPATCFGNWLRPGFWPPGSAMKSLRSGWPGNASQRNSRVRFGWPVEPHAHQVVDLALLQPRAHPERRDRRHLGLLVIGRHLHLEDVVLRQRREVVDDVDARDHVDAAHLHQELAVELLVVADDVHRVEQRRRLEHDVAVVDLAHGTRHGGADAFGDELARTA